MAGRRRANTRTGADTTVLILDIAATLAPSGRRELPRCHSNLVKPWKPRYIINSSKNRLDTVCPKVPLNCNVVLISAICGWILKPFELQIATLGRFDMMYDMQ